MPIDPTPTPGQRFWKISMDGPNSVSFNIDVYADVATEQDADAMTQSLVNHLSQWPDLVKINYAQKQEFQIYNILPDVP